MRAGAYDISWPRAVCGLLVAALVPVAAFAVVFYPYAVLVLMTGIPLALAVAILLVLPVAVMLSSHDKLTRGKAIAIGAVVTPLPFVFLYAGLMTRSLTRSPYVEGLRESKSNDVWHVRDGYLTIDGWIWTIGAPVLAFAVLGAIASIIGWKIATSNARRASNESK